MYQFSAPKIHRQNAGTETPRPFLSAEYLEALTHSEAAAAKPLNETPASSEHEKAQPTMTAPISAGEARGDHDAEEDPPDPVIRKIKKDSRYFEGRILRCQRRQRILQQIYSIHHKAMRRSRRCRPGTSENRHSYATRCMFGQYPGSFSRQSRHWTKDGFGDSCVCLIKRVGNLGYQQWANFSVTGVAGADTFKISSYETLWYVRVLVTWHGRRWRTMANPGVLRGNERNNTFWQPRCDARGSPQTTRPKFHESAPMSITR